MKWPTPAARSAPRRSPPRAVPPQSYPPRYPRVSSLPQRTKVLKDLVESLHKCIGIEREAVGLDTLMGAEGRPMVIIRDFTGRGDVDSPVREAA